MIDALASYRSAIAAASTRYDVPQEWIAAIIMTESSGDAMAYREEPQIHDASYGLMQILTSTAHGLGFIGSADELFDPDTNIDIGARLLGQLRSRYGDNFARVYSAYNSGHPDRYLTSHQVATHVAHAIDWLTRVGTTTSSSLSITALMIVAIIAWWIYRR